MEFDAERDFDFLEGRWDAVCRVPSESGWTEAPGTLDVSRTLDGRVFVELFAGIYHGGNLKGIGKGAFRGGKIDLFADWTESNGRSIHSRLTWSDIAADSAHWEMKWGA